MKRIFPYLFLSLFIHALMAVAVKVDIPKQAKRERYIRASLIRLPQKIKEFEEKPEEDHKDKQVVSQPQNRNNEKPKDAKFLSEEDSTTEKKSVRHDNQSDKSRKEDKKINQDKESKAERKGMPDLKGIDLFPRDAIDKIARQERREERQPGDSGDVGTGVGTDIGTNDALKDIEEGEGTFLNTFAFKYASFFNRIKRDVSDNWNPFAAARRHDPSLKELYKDRSTRLYVVLDEAGKILSIRINKSSGVDFLDEEAIAAFERCSKFENPPKGMIKESKIEFYFGFEVKLERGMLRF